MRCEAEEETAFVSASRESADRPESVAGVTASTTLSTLPQDSRKSVEETVAASGAGSGD